MSEHIRLWRLVFADSSRRAKQVAWFDHVPVNFAVAPVTHRIPQLDKAMLQPDWRLETSNQLVAIVRIEAGHTYRCRIGWDGFGVVHSWLVEEYAVRSTSAVPRIIKNYHRVGGNAAVGLSLAPSAEKFVYDLSTHTKYFSRWSTEGPATRAIAWLPAFTAGT